MGMRADLAGGKAQVCLPCCPERPGIEQRGLGTFPSRLELAANTLLFAKRFNSEPQVNIHCFSGFSQACFFVSSSMCVYSFSSIPSEFEFG